MAKWKHLKYPHLTEKSVTLVEKSNSIVFIVNLRSSKPEIRKEFEEVFEVKVKKININIMPNGQKKAIIQLKPEFNAGDVAVKLGVV